MEIIKPGRDVETIYRKTCSICGCEFKFAEWEVELNFVAQSPEDLCKPDWLRPQVRQITCPNPTCHHLIDVLPSDKIHRVKEIDRMIETMIEHAGKRWNYKE